MRTALKIFNKGNEHFPTAMPAFAKKKLGIEIETTYNIFSMNLVSRKVDGSSFTKKQLAQMSAYEEGYLEAWQMAQDVADGKEPLHA